MKNFKYLLVSFFMIAILIPQLALASWWNPFSWKVFNNSPETKIEKTTTPSGPIYISTQTTNEESKKIDQPAKIKDKVTSASYWKNMEDFLFPIADGQGIISFKAHNERFNDDRYYTKGDNKWVWSSTGSEAIQIFGSARIVCNGENWTSCPAGQKFYCPETGSASCVSSVANNNQNSNSNLSQDYYDRQMLNLELMKVKMQVQQNTALQNQAISKYKDTSLYTPTVFPTENNYSNTSIKTQIPVGQNYANTNSQPQINIYGGASSYQRVGNNTYGSDGSSYTQVGNNVYGSDGTSYTKVGNNTYGSDGSSYTQVGNTTLRNDGSSYTQVGNNIYGSDGSSYTKVGNTILGNGGY